MAFSDPAPTRNAAASIGGIGTGCLFYILLLFPVVIAAGLGACDTAAPCDRSIGRELLLAMAPAILFGAAMRSVLRWLGRRIQAQEPDAVQQPGAAPWWVLAAIPLSILGGTWLVWGEPIWIGW